MLHDFAYNYLLCTCSKIGLLTELMRGGNITLQVEEGVCQLIALLWLQHLAGQHSADDGAGGGPRNGDSPPSAEDLRGFFAHQIKTDISVVRKDEMNSKLGSFLSSSANFRISDWYLLNKAVCKFHPDLISFSHVFVTNSV